MTTAQDQVPLATTQEFAAQIRQALVQAVAFHQNMQLAEARALYEQILQVLPTHFDALHLLGVIAYQTKNPEKAIELIGKAIELYPNNASFYFNRGLAFEELKQYPAALQDYEKATILKPDYAEASNKRSDLFSKLEQLQTFLDSYSQDIPLTPDYADAYYDRGSALLELEQHQAALECFKQAIALKPDYAEAYNDLGYTLTLLNQYPAAVANYNQAIALKPDYPDAYINRGLAMQELEQYQTALESYNQAIALKPDAEKAFSNRGIVHYLLKEYPSALESYNQAIALNPNLPEAYCNRGLVFQNLGQYQAALEEYAQALVLKPDYAEAYTNRGLAFQSLGQYQEALEEYAQAIVLNPDTVEAYNNCGVILAKLKQYQAALVAFDKVIALKPDFKFLFGQRLHVKSHLCDWNDFENECKLLQEKIERSEKAADPFIVLSLINAPSLLRRSADIYAQDKYSVNQPLPKIAKYPKKNKLRIGYFSEDFRNHPVSILMAELFESHDRSQFELTAFSFGPDSQDEMRVRVGAAFDNFIDIRNQTDREVALLARQLEIDIAIDLGGYTGDCRTGIFALRAAPIQVSYIGFLGTMGADFIDYLIADPVIIPEAAKHYYAEKIAYLPSYQANDSKRCIADREFTRNELGLPEQGFVFCCFNNNYKINPLIYDSWMRILKAVEGSVLLLYVDNDECQINLSKEAELRGINPRRIIFGERLPVPEYLARYRCADLFLDTLPYNAGTTASDALWVGLPVLTCMGETFASRVAASLLTAIRLPELITASLVDYEAMAIGLATHPTKLKEIKGKLAHNRLTTPLFNTPLFTRHIEAAYMAMYERYQADLPPDPIYVQDSWENANG